ncbi:hypothetical protein [Acinetobacter sp.]
MSAHEIESSMRKPKILARGACIANLVNDLQNNPVLFDELKKYGD